MNSRLASSAQLTTKAGVTKRKEVNEPQLCVIFLLRLWWSINSYFTHLFLTSRAQASKRMKKSEGDLRPEWQKQTAARANPPSQRKACAPSTNAHHALPPAMTTDTFVATGLSPFEDNITDNAPVTPISASTSGPAKAARNARQVRSRLSLAKHKPISTEVQVRVAVTRVLPEPKGEDGSGVTSSVSSHRNRRWRLIDLPLPHGPKEGVVVMRVWTHGFVPTIIHWAGTKEDTFETNSTVITVVDTIWSLLYPTLPELDDDGRAAVVGNVCNILQYSFGHPY